MLYLYHNIQISIDSIFQVCSNLKSYCKMWVHFLSCVPSYFITTTLSYTQLEIQKIIGTQYDILLFLKVFALIILGKCILYARLVASVHLFIYTHISSKSSIFRIRSYLTFLQKNSLLIDKKKYYTISYYCDANVFSIV